MSMRSELLYAAIGWCGDFALLIDGAAEKEEVEATLRDAQLRLNQFHSNEIVRRRRVMDVNARGKRFAHNMHDAAARTDPQIKIAMHSIG